MHTFWQDFRYGVRVLFKNPGFTFIAVLTLALGIGANTAIFSVVNALLLRPLPYKDAGRLVWIWGTNPGAGIPEEVASAPDYNDWKKLGESFEDMGAIANLSVILGTDGEPERLIGKRVSDGFFSTLQGQPMLGRTFTPEEDKPDAQRVVILSEGLWQRRFGSDPQILEKTITLNGNPHQVVGVMPADFINPQPGDAQTSELWVPLRVNYATAGRRGDFLGVIARLKPEVTREQAQTEMAALMKNLEEQYPASNTGWSAKVITLHERFVGDVSRPLLVLMAAVCFLLLIACVNVANLLLVRASSRRKEVAIRAALGAGRLRIARQLLTESMVLSIFGGALGLLVGVWGVTLLTSYMPANLPRLNEIALDNRALLFTLAVSIFTGVVFGLIPALQSSSPNLNDCLKEGGKDAANIGSSNRLRNVFAVAEIALALILLAGAGLMLRSFLKLQDVDPGFNSQRVIALQMQLPNTRYKEPAQFGPYFSQLLEGVTASSGVESAALISDTPLGGANFLSFQKEGESRTPDDPAQDAEVHSVSPDYFKTMGIPLKRGEFFTALDTLMTPGVAVVSETLVRRYFGDDEPLGKRVTLDGQTWMRIVGVVGDTRNQSLDEAPYPQMYMHIAQQPTRVFNLVVKGAGDATALVPMLRGLAREMDATVPIFNVRSMEKIVSDSVARPRFNALLIFLFAVLALILAGVGIYGVISYVVSQRQHEIGVRLALGARSSDILKMVVGQGFKLVAAGIGIGLVAVLGLTQLLSSLLFGISATDPLTFIAVSAVLSGVALLACYVPARRATKVDPMIALRYE